MFIIKSRLLLLLMLLWQGIPKFSSSPRSVTTTLGLVCIQASGEAIIREDPDGYYFLFGSVWQSEAEVDDDGKFTQTT